jgi:DNA processing protein
MAGDWRSAPIWLQSALLRKGYFSLFPGTETGPMTFASPTAPSPSPTSATVLDETRLAWLAMVLTPGLGPKRILQAVEKTRDVASIPYLPLTELESLGFPASAVQFLASSQARDDAAAEWERICQQGARLVTYSCPEYPERLRYIFDPPPVLWVRGDTDVLNRHSIAVVGTRRPTPYGIGMTEKLSRDLAVRKLVIISGMARGVDSVAHQGALAVQAPTIAVWGTGIDVIYPKENKKLAEDILAGGGAILSEYRLGTFPAPQNFPRRNRIISGMSLGVLVVEAGEHSGTRVTARCAMEQDRDVYAVPGNVTTKNAWGPNMLIKDGARLTTGWEDIWEGLPSQVRQELEQLSGVASESQEAASLFEQVPVTPQEALVLKMLSHDEALHIDELLEKLESDLSSSEVFMALFELEQSGRVRQLPGKNYVKSL